MKSPHLPRLLGLLCLCILDVFCGNGLEPVDSAQQTLTGFSGRITCLSTWPPSDSILTLRVVAVRRYPPTNILEEFSAGRLEFSEPLQLNVPEQSFVIQKDTLRGAFEYIAIAQQYGSNIFENWRVVGVYSKTGNPSSPSPLVLEKGRILQDINISIDFYHLPPQPF